MRKPALPLGRRFHKRPGDRLRAWESTLWLMLHTKSPELRLWVNAFADGIYIIYRSRHRRAVDRELGWLLSDEIGSLTCFRPLAEALDFDPDDIRRDVLSDIEAGKTKIHAA